MKVALEVAAKLFNFKTSVKEISKRGEVLEVSQYVCELAEVIMIFIIFLNSNLLMLFLSVTLSVDVDFCVICFEFCKKAFTRYHPFVFSLLSSKEKVT